MFRVKLVLIGLGCAIVFWGFQEYRVSEGTSTEPVAVELAKLEAGDELPNNHIKIGEHIGVMGGVIYEYSQSKYSTAEPTASTSVSVAYYPIISTSHTFAREMAKSMGMMAGGMLLALVGVGLFFVGGGETASTEDQIDT